MSGKCHEKLYRIGQAEKRLIWGWVSFGEQSRVSFPERQGNSRSLEELFSFYLKSVLKM